MKRLSIFLATALLGLAACGGDEESTTASAMRTTAEPAAEPAQGTKLKLRASDYGRMLFGPGRQAIYIFELDEPGKSNCYGDCARAWPPVLTKGKPIAGDGVRTRLLGRTTRRDGKRQVTYNGRPLYYYAHEGPDEVLCHDVFLNGGYWWAVGRNGNRRP